MSGNASSAGNELFEFGPFRVDPEKELLLRDGVPIPLTPKTFQILLVLLRHQKEVVTKEELMKQVWPDTFVEEANLSRNIFMLRKALGETPQDHRYILTVPGRGYRLAEEVRLVSDTEVSVVAATRSTVTVEVTESRPWAWIAAGALLLLIVAAAAWWFASHRPPVLGTKDGIVVADFNNTTGDAVFDETLRQGLAVQLAQSPFLSVVSDQRIKSTLALMGKANDARLTPEIASDICQRTGSTVTLEGSIAVLGSDYVVGMRASNCRTGAAIFDEQTQAHKKEEVLAAIGELAREFRTKAGESLTSLAKYDVPLADATTASLDALKAFTNGMKVLHAGGSNSAIPFFKRAIEIDPNFALAHAFLGRMYGDLGEFDLSAASTAKAYQLRNRTSERERYFIMVSYDTQVTGNLEKARQTCESWIQVYPRDPIPHSMMSGIILPALGRYEQAAAHGRIASEVEPDFSVPYAVIAYAEIELERYAEAEQVLRKAAERKLERPEFLVTRYDLAFLRHDQAEMERLSALGEQDPETNPWIINHEAFVAAYQGRLQHALELTHRAAASTDHADQRERAAQFLTGAAIWQALYDDAKGARRTAADALKLSHDRDVEYGAAFALAAIGDLKQAESLTQDFAARFPEDTSVKFSYLPVLQATFALRKNEPSRAIEELNSAIDYELGCPRSCQHGFYGAMYPIYVRGEAYLALHEGNQAAAEFQKIIAHPGIIISDPVAALARLQLARAYALSQETSKAKAAYQDFLNLWHDADANSPVLARAIAEFRQLN